MRKLPRPGTGLVKVFRWSEKGATGIATLTLIALTFTLVWSAIALNSAPANRDGGFGPQISSAGAMSMPDADTTVLVNIDNNRTVKLSAADGAILPSDDLDDDDALHDGTASETLNPADGMLYRREANCGPRLSQIDTSRSGATNWSIDLSAHVASSDALAVQPVQNGYVYVASVSSSKIVVVNPATRRVVTSFGTAIPPRYITVNPNGGNVFIADGASHFVHAYSPTGSLLWISPDLGGAASSIETTADVAEEAESIESGSPSGSSTPPPCSHTFDFVNPPVLPAGWIATNALGPDPLWETSNSGNLLPVADTLPNSAFVDDPNEFSDKALDSPQVIVPSSGPAQVSFRHRVELEDTFDGGVLEISINGGAFQDIIVAGGSFATGGYNGTISTAFNNPLAGRDAWTGSIGSTSGFTSVVANLPGGAAGQTVVLRWRMASDDSVSSLGWRIDTISIACPSCPPPTAKASVSPTSIQKGQDAVFTFTAHNNCNDITIIYQMKGRAKLGLDYTLSGTAGQAFIPAGQGSTTVTLHALFNSRTHPAPANMKLKKSSTYYLGTKKVTVTLTGPYGPG